MVELANPISVDMSSMRPGLLPGLLGALQRNRDHGEADGALFELGQAYRGDEPQDQFMAAAGVRAGTAKLPGAGRFWNGASEAVDLFDAKADVMALLAALGFDEDKVQITRDAPGWFHPGRSGVVRLGPKLELAHFGELHPGILAQLDVAGPVMGFELFLSSLPLPRQKSGRTRAALEISDLHPVRRDFAFLLARDVPAGDVLRAARSADKALIDEVRLFDCFAGEGLGEDKKSLAIEVTLQPRGRSLTDEQIEAISQKIVAAVSKATGGQIRG